MFNQMQPYLSIQSKISDKLRDAESRLEASGYNVVRHVRVTPAHEVFGLEVWGDCFYHLEKVRAVVGQGYKLVLNIQMQTILIR
jgi:hypothetical protein